MVTAITIFLIFQRGVVGVIFAETDFANEYQKTAFGVVYGCWVIVILILYPICLKWSQFKFKKPATSIWRFF